MDDYRKTRRETIESLRREQERLADLESRARTPEGAELFRRARDTLAESAAEVEAGPSVLCPRCLGKVPLSTGAMHTAICPLCERTLDLDGVCAVNGLWKVNLTFAVGATVLAVALFTAAFLAPFVVLRLAAALGGLFLALVALAEWFWAARALRWWLRHRGEL